MKLILLGMRSMIAVFLLTCGLTAAAQAATITVNTLADENNTNAAACSLREAINNANNDNTTSGLGCVAGAGTDSIVISVNGTITPATALPVINSSLSITGGGASLSFISGNNARRVFTINSGTVSISSLSIVNGFDATQGGGINIDGGTVTLSNIVVADSVSGQGGGIQNNATLTVNNSTVNNNQATVSLGGGILNYGTLTVNTSTISNNQGSAQGGGICNVNGSATIADTTFTGNSSPNYGGAIINNGGSVFSVTRSVFTGNNAGSGGGALFITSPFSSTVTNSTFFNNTSGAASVLYLESALTMTNCTVSGNRSGSGYGFEITSAAGDAVLVNNIIAGNTNTAQTIQRDIITTVGGAVITGSSFNNIIGTGGAGGLTNGVNSNQVGVALANVRLLPLGNYGGEVQTMPIRVNSPARNAGTNTGAPLVDARGYNRPQAATSDIGAFEIQSNSIVTNTNNSGAGSLRDVIAAVPASEVVQFETPLFNSAQTIALSGGQININKNLTVFGSGANILTVQNTAAASASSRVFAIASGNVNLSNMTVTGGNPTGSGGGINVSGSTLTLDSVHVTGNTGAFGGGISVNTAGTLNLFNSTVSSNTATAAGGTGGGIDNNNVLNVVNSTISGNTVTNAASANGGGIWTGGSGGAVLISNSTITDNEAGSGGAGGVYRDNSALTIRSSIIANNRNNSTIPDVRGTVLTSQGFNLIGNRGTTTGFTQPSDQTGTGGSPLSPLLRVLGLWGGTVPTHDLLPGSPALDKGNAFGLTNDQRGLLRIVDLAGIASAPGGDGTDIGAIEAPLVPTSAALAISGRVLSASGAGLKNATVVLTAVSGEIKTAKTSSFGYYRFEDLTVGETYIISVASKLYFFQPRVIQANEDLSEVDFEPIAGSGETRREKNF